MDTDEKRISQEDCNEDTIGVGFLTLTNKRVAFDKKESRVMDFSARMGDTVLNVPLENVTKVWKEGLLMKKICHSRMIFSLLRRTYTSMKRQKKFYRNLE